MPKDAKQKNLEPRIFKNPESKTTLGLRALPPLDGICHIDQQEEK